MSVKSQISPRRGEKMENLTMLDLVRSLVEKSGGTEAKKDLALSRVSSVKRIMGTIWCTNL